MWQLAQELMRASLTAMDCRAGGRHGRREALLGHLLWRGGEQRGGATHKYPPVWQSTLEACRWLSNAQGALQRKLSQYLLSSSQQKQKAVALAALAHLKQAGGTMKRDLHCNKSLPQSACILPPAEAEGGVAGRLGRVRLRAWGHAQHEHRLRGRHPIHPRLQACLLLPLTPCSMPPWNHPCGRASTVANGARRKKGGLHGRLAAQLSVHYACRAAPSKHE